MPLGGVVSEAAASASFSLTGKAKLAQTARADDSSVLNRYRKITVRNCLPMPEEACASELMTKINTSSGAIAFSAPTNMVPRIEMPAACGTTSARMIPMIKPMMIRRIKLISFHFLMTFFIFSCPSITVFF